MESLYLPKYVLNFIFKKLLGSSYHITCLPISSHNIYYSMGVKNKRWWWFLCKIFCKGQWIANINHYMSKHIQLTNTPILKINSKRWLILKNTVSPDTFSFFSFILTQRKLRASPKKVHEYMMLFYISVPSGTMNFLICKTRINRRCLEQCLAHTRYSINVNWPLFMNAVFSVLSTTK